MMFIQQKLVVFGICCKSGVPELDTLAASDGRQQLPYSFAPGAAQKFDDFIYPCFISPAIKSYVRDLNWQGGFTAVLSVKW